MTTIANQPPNPERVYERCQFEMHDAPEDVKGYALLLCLTTGELITNDTLMNAIQMGMNMLPRVAPTGGDRVRITELLTDEVRHCYMNDHLARALGGDPSAIDYFSPSAEGLARAFGQDPGVTTSMTELPGAESLLAIPQLITDGMTQGMSGQGSYLWSLFAVFNMCIDRAASMMIEDSLNGSFGPLARMNGSIAVDEAGHAQTGFHHLREVCRTEEGRREAQVALDAIWPVSLTMFDMMRPQQAADLLRLGLLDHTHAELKTKYINVTVPLLEGLDLGVPTAA